MATTPDKTQSPPARRGRAVAVAGDATFHTAALFARKGFANPVLVLRWPEIAGAEVARLTRPLKLTEGPSGGTLTLLALPGSAVFLSHETRTLCARINGFLGQGAVTRLKFVQGPLSRAPSPSSLPKTPGPLAATDPARRFAGPPRLAEALAALGRRRTAPSGDVEP